MTLPPNESASVKSPFAERSSQIDASFAPTPSSESVTVQVVCEKPS